VCAGRYWGFGDLYQRDDNLEAYKALIDSNIDFVDTAEVRGMVPCPPVAGEKPPEHRSDQVMMLVMDGNTG
jgi:hypothetical protein